MLKKLNKRYKKVHSNEEYDYYVKINCVQCRGRGTLNHTFPTPIKVKGELINKTQSKCSCVIKEKKELQEICL